MLGIVGKLFVFAILSLLCASHHYDCHALRINRRQSKQSRRTGLRRISARSYSSTCKAFLSGRHILWSGRGAEDIKQYCKSKSVNALGCYLLRSRAWSTQSAKLSVADTSSEQVLVESFWPRLVRCRPWERDPPRRSNLSTQHAED